MVYTLKGVYDKMGMAEGNDLLNCSESVKAFPFECSDFWEVETDNDGRGHLIYKNVVEPIDIKQMIERIPSLKGISWPEADKMPYFVSGLHRIEDALRNGKAVGIEGGPCLFGAYEVVMTVELDDGKKYSFDYSTCFPMEDGRYVREEEELIEFVEKNASRIRNIEFDDCKKGLTVQEYYTILYMFEIGKALGVKIFISFPDMSYIKFLESVMEVIPNEAVKSDAIGAFRRIAHRITDLYLEKTSEIEKEYPQVKVNILHERMTEDCKKYYTERIPFIERKKILRKINSCPQRVESLKDYISLSATPYYLEGITEILHVCSLYEADSFRKCRKAHKGIIEMSCILYPEYISKDGKNSVFYAPMEYKDYI